MSFPSRMETDWLNIYSYFAPLSNLLRWICIIFNFITHYLPDGWKRNRIVSKYCAKFEQIKLIFEKFVNIYSFSYSFFALLCRLVINLNMYYAVGSSKGPITEEWGDKVHITVRTAIKYKFYQNNWKVKMWLDSLLIFCPQHHLQLFYGHWALKFW